MGGAFWKLGAGKRVVTCKVRGRACSIQSGQPDCRQATGGGGLEGACRASAREAPSRQLQALQFLPPEDHSSPPLPEPQFMASATFLAFWKTWVPVYSFKIIFQLFQRGLPPCVPLPIDGVFTSYKIVGFRP